jgi:hypothetical protein
MKLRLKEDPREWQKHLLVMAFIAEAVVALLFARGRLSGGIFKLAQPVLAAVLACGAIRPRWFRGFYRGGMTANYWVGKIVGRATLTMFFFLAVTPLGLIIRLCGRDLLKLRPRPPGESYWRKSPPASPFDRLF